MHHPLLEFTDKHLHSVGRYTTLYTKKVSSHRVSNVAGVCNIKQAFGYISIEKLEWVKRVT